MFCGALAVSENHDLEEDVDYHIVNFLSIRA
jgi:hypothetical protein